MRTKICFMGLLILVIVALLAGCASVGEVALKSYIHSKAEEAKARRQAKYIAEEMRATPEPTTNPADKALKNAKESIIKTKGKPHNVVKIDEAGSEVWEYYNSPEKGKVRLYAFLNGELKNVGSRNMDEYGANSNDMVFLKKRYTDTVPCYANLRTTLPYTPRPGDTAETVLAQLGKPDDTIPLYYEEGIAVSEMLIYYESPKKFLAVGIARGKVVRTQEFALSEGQGLKDALASAGITPAAAPEPTPAPSVRIPLGTIPTTGFLP